MFLPHRNEPNCHLQLFILELKSTLQSFTPWKLQGLGIAGFLQGLYYLWKTGVRIIVGKPRDNCRSCNYYKVSLQFLQPFSIDCANFRCRDPTIPSPRSFHLQCRGYCLMLKVPENSIMVIHFFSKWTMHISKMQLHIWKSPIPDPIILKWEQQHTFFKFSWISDT